VCARTVLPATKDDAGIATRHPQFASLVSARRCQRVNPSRTDFRTSRIRHFAEEPKAERLIGTSRDVLHQAPRGLPHPEDARRRREEQPDAGLRQGTCRAAIVLSRRRHSSPRAQSFPSICPRLTIVPGPVPASVLEDEGVRRRLGAQQQQHDSQEPVQAAVSARDEPIFPWIFTSQPRFPPIFPES